MHKAIRLLILTAALILCSPKCNAQVPTNTPIRDKWALVIGLSQFAHPEYNLKYSAQDATDFKNFLVNNAHFAPDHIKVLLNQQATRQAIMDSFGETWLPRVAMPGDLVVIYMSTHGTPSSRDYGQQNYVVAYDTDRDHLYATGVNMNDLCNQVKQRVGTDRVLLILDTCYSGAAAAGARGLERMANFDAEALAQGSGRLVISSSSPNERSWESKTYPNGIFTHNLISALKEENGKVDMLTAFNKMKDAVEWETQSSYGAQQHPMLGGKWEGTNLVLSAPPSQPRRLPPDVVAVSEPVVLTPKPGTVSSTSRPTATTRVSTPPPPKPAAATPAASAAARPLSDLQKRAAAERKRKVLNLDGRWRTYNDILIDIKQTDGHIKATLVNPTSCFGAGETFWEGDLVSSKITDQTIDVRYKGQALTHGANGCSDAHVTDVEIRVYSDYYADLGYIHIAVTGTVKDDSYYNSFSPAERTLHW